MGQTTPKISFNFNRKKAVEAVLYIINKSKKDSYDLYKIVKMIFEAEIFHINNYVRPITGDRFVAMNHGIVPSNIYDLIRYNKNDDDFYKKGKKTIKANRKPDVYYLSKSDIKALDHAFELFNNKSFDEIREYNHKYPAWEKYHNADTSTLIPFEDIVSDVEICKELEEISSSILI